MRSLEGHAEIEHTLAQLVALTGWVEGQIEALTIEARINAEAEALAKERLKRVGFRPAEGPD